MPNNSGGGTALWLVNSLNNILRNRRIKKHNIQARGVEELQSIDTKTLLPFHSYKDNIVISGGNQNERLHVCEQVLNNAYNAKHPIILLHIANNTLENILTGNKLGIIVNANNKIFDAFISFEFNEIVQIILDTCKSKYDIKPAGRYVLQVVYDLLINRGRKPYFSSFANCPYYKISDHIYTRLNNGGITQDIADKLNSLLLTGQTECPKIDTFFSDIKSQIDYFSSPDPNKIKAVSILSAIKNKQILCLDLRSSANVMLVELIVNSLIIAMNRGYNFSLLIDDIAFINNEILKNAICQKSNHQNIIISKDLYALTGGKEDVFSTIIGNIDKTILFKQSSSVSCEKWSKYVGEYEKIDVSQNTNSGWNQSSKWGFNTNYGQTETLKREYKVKPEQINRLLQNEAIIYDNTTGSLIKTFIT